MDPLLGQLLRLLHRHYGWQRSLLLTQSREGRVAWLRLPEDMPVSLRLNADDTVSLTSGRTIRRGLPRRARGAGRLGQ